MEVWPKRFPTIDAAHYYEHSPERLANLVYASRMGNGAYESGDGWRYHGRGPIQLTGADAYRRAGIALNLPLIEQPDQVLQPQVGAQVAAWFFTDRGCDGLDIQGSTQRINGGLLGLDDRQARYFNARRVLAS
jgi:putative chitinase